MTKMKRYKFALQRKSSRKNTEYTPNRTYQPYSWKEIALSDNLKALSAMKGKEDRIIDYNTLAILVPNEY